jgi:hypothetical protein
MYVFSLISHVLLGTLACLAITDQRPLLSRQLCQPLYFAESDFDFALCLPNRKDPGFVSLFLSPVLVSSLLTCYTVQIPPRH